MAARNLGPLVWVVEKLLTLRRVHAGARLMSLTFDSAEIAFVCGDTVQTGAEGVMG